MQDKKATDHLGKKALEIEDLTECPSSVDADDSKRMDSVRTQKSSLEEALAARKREEQADRPKSIRDIALDIAQPFRLPKRSAVQSRKKEEVFVPEPYPKHKRAQIAQEESDAEKESDALSAKERNKDEISAKKIQAASVILPGDSPLDLVDEPASRACPDGSPLQLIMPEGSVKEKTRKTKSEALAERAEARASGDMQVPETEKPSLLARMFTFKSSDKADAEKKTPSKREAEALEDKNRQEAVPQDMGSQAEKVESRFNNSMDSELSPKEEEERVQKAREAITERELELALEAAGIDPALSTCEELRLLESQLRDGKSPFFQDDKVVIERKPALQLIQGLTALCDSQAGEGFEDELFDRLASSNHLDDADFKPMYRVKNRAQSILEDASRQADYMLRDARTVANQLLRDTDAKIQEKYDQADMEIEQRLSSSKEESVKRLTEAREELTASRKQSVDILNLYMDKAEDDYQGYWERAEQTLFASLLRSDQVLSKAEDIYRKEILAISEDLDVLKGILEDLERMRP